MMDVSHHVNAVARTVGARTLDAGEARVVTLGRSYPTDAADLWDACTSAERLPRWFAPVHGELRLDGKYQVEGNASGTVLTCDPPRTFTATWEFGGGVSWIELRIFDEGPDQARMQLDHIALVGDEMWPQYGPGAVGIGWDLAVLGLAIHLETGESVPDEFREEEWSTTGAGRDYIAAAGEGWYAAQVASGEDAAVARRAADNSIAFYRGDPPPS
ncbi:SRPBCC family protein [Mycobacterium sp. 236(2023)]|uniref:SRPBCC family protein n=1 Tax=Mycobacterium sp. 236(2023) TaxID=3038163 RepID=UPI00241521E2|nr:SRPBCC family protein [Mycobacterium sp. 236(2023)]MDG4665791.1 SRPBCC family protein [Mycobacterium sp. 236(2023)]